MLSPKIKKIGYVFLFIGSCFPCIVGTVGYIRNVFFSPQFSVMTHVAFTNLIITGFLCGGLTWAYLKTSKTLYLNLYTIVLLWAGLNDFAALLVCFNRGVCNIVWPAFPLIFGGMGVLILSYMKRKNV